MRYLRLPDGSGIPVDSVRSIFVALNKSIEISLYYNNKLDIYTLHRTEYKGDPAILAGSLMDQVERLTEGIPAAMTATIPTDLMAKLSCIHSDLFPAVESLSSTGSRIDPAMATSRFIQGFRDLSQLIEELRCQTPRPTG